MARTYVITGAGSGIGAATAAMLRKNGDKVIGVDLKKADVIGDLSTPKGRLDAAEAAIKLARGKVDGVIACAGLAIPQPITVSVNYFGMTEFLNAMLPALAKSKAPRAVLISSFSSLQDNDKALVNALVADDEKKALKRAAALAADPEKGNLIYASTKRAISRWVRREAPKAQWAGAGIPLNAIGPGIVKTPMTSPLMASPDAVKFLDTVVPMPLNYHLDPKQVAKLLIWLTSVENTHICGQTIYIDGGSDVVMRGENVWDLK